jgi:uncharacterized delta-60 repeat protein
MSIQGNYSKRKSAYIIVQIALTFVFTINLSAADGLVDPFFQTGYGVNGGVKVVALQPDGKILIGGWFTQISGLPNARIGRLNPDGSVDPSFRTGLGFDDDVLSIVVQPDGKILVAGEFNYFDGEQRAYLTRLNPDGSRDESFAAGDGAAQMVPGFIQKIVLQPDGKILVGGNFRHIGGSYLNNIARLNPDGTADSSFNIGTGTLRFPEVGQVYTICLQPDGKVIVGGAFATFNGTPRNKIVRLMPNGSADSSFAPQTGSFQNITGIGIQPDGKILIGGAQTWEEGRIIHRLNPDGSIDPDFVRHNGGLGTIAQIDVQADGKILVTSGAVMRFLNDGNRDQSFVTSGADSSAVQPDGRIVICGQFGDPYYLGAIRVGRLSASGAFDWTFVPHRLIGGGRVLAVQPDGKMITALPTYYQQIGVMPGIIRRNKDGTFDPTFDPGTGLGGDTFINAMELQPDGKLVIAGTLKTYNGTPRPGLARLNTNGSLDTTFDPVLIGLGQYQSLKIQPDGKIIVSGDFSTSTHHPRFGIARLNPDGSLDTTFNAGTIDPVDRFITKIALQTDGKIVLGGWFRSIGGVMNAGVARLNSDGSLDTTFDAGIGVGNSFQPFVDTVAIQADGKILIGGKFSSYQGVVRNRIARLNPNGSLDASFVHQLSGDNFDVRVTDIDIQADGKVLVAEANYNDGDTTPVRLIRVNPDGTTDPTFVVDQRYKIDQVVIEPDGHILATGQNITEAPWILSRRGLVRFLNPSQLVTTTSISGRVTTPFGQGLRNAVVTLRDQLGSTQTATTSSFGVYSFGSVLTNQTYTVGVLSKRYRFTARSINVSGQLTNIDFVGLE